jgi:hypothetical protein
VRDPDGNRITFGQEPANASRKSAIVTARKPGKRYA